MSKKTQSKKNRHARKNRKSQASRGRQKYMLSYRPESPLRVFFLLSESQFQALSESTKYGPGGPLGLVHDLATGNATEIPCLPMVPGERTQVVVEAVDAVTYARLQRMSAVRDLSVHSMIQEGVFGKKMQQPYGVRMTSIPSKGDIQAVRAYYEGWTDERAIGAILMNQLFKPGAPSEGNPTDEDWHVLSDDGIPCCPACPDVMVGFVRGTMRNR